MKAYAVVNEGHVLDYITQNDRGIIVATSYWLTRDEAQFAIDRTFSHSFGTWKPKARWIVECDVHPFQISTLAHNAPEYARP
jgi:hypothetical protein